MLNPLLLFTAQVVASMSVLLLAAGYLKTDPLAASSKIFALMADFIVFYLVNGMSSPHIDNSLRIDHSAAGLVITLGINAICGLFMFYCFLIFQEQQRFPAMLGVAFALQMCGDL